MTPNARARMSAYPTIEPLPDRYATFSKCDDCGSLLMVVTVRGQASPRPLCDDCRAVETAADCGTSLDYVLIARMDEASEVLGTFSTKEKAENAMRDVADRYPGGIAVRTFARDCLRTKGGI